MNVDVLADGMIGSHLTTGVQSCVHVGRISHFKYGQVLQLSVDGACNIAADGKTF